MKTIKELEKYFEEECFSFTDLSIGNHHAYEGYVIKKDRNQFIFGYSERGNTRIIKSFLSEEELVKYALIKLNDKCYKSHLVAWLWNEREIKEAELELTNMNISFERNDIPNYDLEHGKAYRIFVFGKDLYKLSEFIKKYLKHQEE